MPWKLEIRPRARLDLEEIWEFIRTDNPAAADRVAEEFESTLADLCHLPGKGHTHASVRNKAFRFWRVHSYLLVYRYDDTVLTLVRVIHGRRNFPELLRDPE